jgi:hypothetical protein
VKRKPAELGKGLIGRWLLWKIKKETRGARKRSYREVAVNKVSL